MGKTAFVLGYTGETGKSVIKEINARKRFHRVLLIGRREVKLDNEMGPEFEQKVIDFDNKHDYEDVFHNIDVGFCCLGTTNKAGKDGFVKVDHDYIVQSAKIAKQGGCKHFLLVFSAFANRNSCFLYTRVKGEVEEELKTLNFNRLSIFRPGTLLCDRVERRPIESCVRSCYKCLPQCIVKPSAISTNNLAKAMVGTTLDDSLEGVETYENHEIYDLL